MRSAGLRVRHCKGCGGCCADAVRVRAWRLNTPLLTLHALSSASCSCPLRAAHSPRYAPGSCPRPNAFSTLERDIASGNGESWEGQGAPLEVHGVVSQARDPVAVVMVAVPTMLGAVPVVHLVPATASAGSQELLMQAATAVQRPHSSVGAFFSLSISSKKYTALFRSARSRTAVSRAKAEQGQQHNRARG